MLYEIPRRAIEDVASVRRFDGVLDECAGKALLTLATLAVFEAALTLFGARHDPRSLSASSRPARS